MEEVTRVLRKSSLKLPSLLGILQLLDITLES
jgi:hypothetical protein